MQSPEKSRLNKYLALRLGISRREADNMISAKKVVLNGLVAELGMRFNEGDELIVNGQKINNQIEYKYFMLNKPVGYICSRKQQGNSPTIYSLLPKELTDLKPVGRLDRDSSGLILLTNDGDFAYHMTHPKFFKTKIYQVALDRDLEPLHQQMISDYGIDLQDGVSKLTLERMEDNRRYWTVTMHEGRNRQIRRTFAALGYSVVKLHRTNFGNYTLDNLKFGEFKSVKKF